MPVTVVSSSSASNKFKPESESESESSGSSDSDGLENWMILGQGMQDGDYSISLNLKGGSHSRTGGHLFLFTVRSVRWATFDELLCI